MRNIACLLLAAGIGSRLKPFTDYLPKCLMPISGMPLLEIWLDTMAFLKIKKILVNMHYKKDDVFAFLNRFKFKDRVDSVYEEELLGTAGTLKKNYLYFKGKTTLLVHGDNLCVCEFDKFLEYHFESRPKDTLITMMTFISPTPESCGIVELDANGVVQKFHEKVKNPPSNLANAAIYILEPEVLEWIMRQENIGDFSTEVLPFFMGKIATWENTGIMRDIGNPKSLQLAQKEFPYKQTEPLDDWQKKYYENPIHKLILQDA